MDRWPRRHIQGFTLVEMLVGLGVAGLVGVIASSLLLTSSNFATDLQTENNRAELLRTIMSGVRSSSVLSASLTDAITCLDNATYCNVMNNVDFSLKPQRAMAAIPSSEMTATTDPAMVTGSDGKGYFKSSGQHCSAAEIDNGRVCPIVVTTQYSIGCGTSVRIKCAPTQAVARVTYTMAPNNAATIKPLGKQTFQTVSATETVPLTNLVSNGTADVSSKNMSLQMKAFDDHMSDRRCPPGQLATGVQPDGTPVCQNVTSACPRGKTFIGFTSVAGVLTPNCQNLVCPTAGQVLVGLDPVTGNPICRAINDTVTCKPTIAGAFNGGTNQFMTGIQADGAPICHRKTCAPGKISACWVNGDIQCVDTSFIPRCPSGTCSAPPATDPPGVGTFYTAPTVPLGYDGIPWISQWSNGEPIQGYRMTYKDRGAGIGATNNPVQSGIFSDNLSPAGQISATSCQYDGDGANLKVTHTWITWVSESPQPYYPDCIHVMNPGNPSATPVPIPPFDEITNSPCYDPTDPYVGYTNHAIQNYVSHSEVCTLVPNPAGNSVTASCPTPVDATPCGTASNQVLGNSCHVLSGWSLRASCNYYYNKPGPVCGGSPSSAP